MSIYRRGNVWWIFFIAPSGKRIRGSTGTTDRAQAQEYHDRQRTKHWEHQRLGIKPERSWREASVRWVKERSHKRTQQCDIGFLRRLDPYLGELLLSQITRDVVDQFAARKAQESSPATANRHLTVIRSILRRARDEWEWIDKIPKIRLFSETQRRVRWLKREEAQRLLSELPPHLRDMAQFSLATGLRQRNVSHLRWDQVDVERAVAWIHPDQAKARRAIAVPLNQDAVMVLKRRMGQHDEYVFTFRNQPVGVCTTKAWWNALERAGIKEFRWHDLRHTWASWHVQSGTSLQELKELGGWASLEMVMRYAHLASDQLKTAARRIECTFSTQPTLKLVA